MWLSCRLWRHPFFCFWNAKLLHWQIFSRHWQIHLAGNFLDFKQYDYQTSYYELHNDRFCLLLSKNYELVIPWNLYEVHKKLLNQLVFIISLNDPNMHTEWYLSFLEQKYAYYFLTKFTILAIVLWAMQPKAQCNSVTVVESAKFRKFDLHKLSQPIPLVWLHISEVPSNLIIAF